MTLLTQKRTLIKAQHRHIKRVTNIIMLNLERLTITQNESNSKPNGGSTGGPERKQIKSQRELSTATPNQTH